MSAFGNGGPAFPAAENSESWGMTMRDYFAAKVLQGAIADPKVSVKTRQDGAILARAAYFLADAMLAERVKP